MACTSFCSCQGSEECFNVHIKQVEIELDDDDNFFPFGISSYMLLHTDQPSRVSLDCPGI